MSFIEAYMPENKYVRQWIYAFLVTFIFYFVYLIFLIPLTESFQSQILTIGISASDFLVGSVEATLLTAIVFALFLNIITYYADSWENFQKFLRTWLAIPAFIFFGFVLAFVLETIAPQMFLGVTINEVLGIQDRFSVDLPYSLAVSVVLLALVILAILISQMKKKK